MKKIGYFYIIIVLLILPLANAAISMTASLKNSYNIGDEFSSSFNVLEDRDIKGVFSAVLNCKSYSLNYFTTFIDFKKGSTEAISAPKLPILNPMLGQCTVNAKVEDVDHNLIESYSSAAFDISNKLNASVGLNKDSFMPGEELSMYIEAYLSYSKASAKNIKISLEGNDYELKGNENKFDYKIQLDSKIKSGKHTLKTTISDEFGNSFSGEKEFSVNAIPTTLGVKLDRTNLAPRESINIKSGIYDQAGDEIKEALSLDISGKKITLVKKEVMSGEDFSYAIPAFTPPGNYDVKAGYKGLSFAGNFSVDEVRKINAQIENSTVIVENIGNVLYDDNIILDAYGEKIYNITYRIKLEPAEKEIIDLSKFISLGRYNLSIYGFNESVEKNIEINNDNRPWYRKIGQGLITITGGTVKAIYPNTGMNLFLLFIALTIPMLLIFTYKKLKKEFKEGVERIVKVENEKVGILKSNLRKVEGQKDKIQKTFQKFVDPAVFTQLIEKPEAKIQGEKREISILFCDIRQFSSLSEKSDMWDIFNMLNMFFKHMTEVIRNHNGTVNKFIGDSIMALFNAPVKDENHVINSVRAAVEMMKEIELLNKKLAELKLNPISMGIGINSGEAIIGNIGAHHTMEYTAIGNTVNLAARLQEKAKPGQILVTKDVYEKIKDSVMAEQIGKIGLKNIEFPVEIYNIKLLR